MRDHGARPGAGEDEATLVARAKGDRQAFAQLYARYLDPVYRYCYRRLGSQQAAEDATSRTFQRALTALPGFRGGSFGAWLFAIARNVVADSFSRERPEPPLDPEVPAATGPEPEAALLAAEARCTLAAALAQLTDDQRSVIELRLAGLTGAEIAQALGRSLGSVKMLQLRGLNRLRGLLGDEAGVEEAGHGHKG